jgi:hypothetical protein
MVDEILFSYHQRSDNWYLTAGKFAPDMQQKDRRNEHQTENQHCHGITDPLMRNVTRKYDRK